MHNLINNQPSTAQPTAGGLKSTNRIETLASIAPAANDPLVNAREKPAEFTVELSPILLLNLYRTIVDLFEVNEQFQFVNNTHLFMPYQWRNTSVAEFDHIGSREAVYRGLSFLADAGFIEMAFAATADQLLLYLHEDVLNSIITIIDMETAYAKQNS